MQTELDAARDAATAGAAVVSSRSGRIAHVRSKGSPTDYVSDVDIDAGVAIVKVIAARIPNARFVVEEPEVYELAGVVPGSLDDDEIWVVDPLDGTTSFLHGYPSYSVSVALIRSGQPVVGAVYDVPSSKLASAASRQGATLAGARIQCTGAARAADALLITGFPYDRGSALDRQLVVLERFLRTPIHGIRRDGTAALDCVRVAANQADGFWEYGLKPWDMAAGVVILSEAGARVTGIEGEEWNTGSTGIIAANPALHTEMLEIVSSAADI